MLDLIKKKGHQVEPGDRILIGDNRGDALVRRVHSVGDEAIPSEVYITWDTNQWNNTVKRTIPANETVYVYPPTTTATTDRPCRYQFRCDRRQPQSRKA